MTALRARLAGLDEYDALAVTALLWFLGLTARYTFPPLFPTFQATYGVSNTTLGLLFTALMTTYAGMQFPSGALADRFGAVRVIAAGALTLAAASLLLAASQVFAVLVVSMVLIGVGTGAHKTVTINLLSTLYPARTGRVLGVLDAVGGLSGVLAPALVVAVLSTSLGWNLIFVGIGAGGVALAAATRLRVPIRMRESPEIEGDSDVTDDAATAADGDASYLTAFTDVRFLLFTVVVITYGFSWNGMASFLPLYLTTEKGLGTGTAGLLYSGLFLVSVIQPATGALSDRIGELRVIGTALLVATIGLVLLYAASGTLAVAIVVGVIGIGFHGMRPVRDAYLVKVIPDEVAGGTLGIVRTLMMAGSAAAPAVVGYLSEVVGFPAAYGLLAAVVAVGVVLTAVIAVT